MTSKYAKYIPTAIIIILAAALAAVLLFMYNQPAPQRGIAPLVEVAANEPDSSVWAQNFPNQGTTFEQTAANNVRTTYGGSDNFDKLAVDPNLTILFAGMPFSKGYTEDRGHGNALTDILETARVNEKTPGTCYSCKSANNPGLWTEMGMTAYDATPFADLGQHIDQTIGCANCHDAETMALVVTNPALEEALEAQGKDWRTFTRQEMRTVVCANCHVEYYFQGDGKYLTFPWEQGTQIQNIVAYYNEVGFKDWEYPETGIAMLKAQHPEYELFSAGSTHYAAGVSCADCHMPYTRDGAAKFSDHNVRSPLLQPEKACGACHTEVTYVVERVRTIQDQTNKAMLSAEAALVDSLTAIKAAAADPNANATLLDEARAMHRDAQMYWDFIAAENSMGFHNPEEALRILGEATDMARQAQLKAIQALTPPAQSGSN
ncbi:MAG TPA: ammonia-forming cytochrome c nitrite reductase subunit c552 [Anaerolineales bacterium]|nr:ammonia-forming cytochrome c nitrite reductase subunit c552 [Anaerolineales bacterium]